MLRVAVLSPLGACTRAGLEDHVAYARVALRDSLSRGEAPWASHLLYPQVLDDMQADQRGWGMAAGAAWEAVADMAAVYADRGISAGMRASIRTLSDLGLPIEYRYIEASPPTERAT